MIDSKLFSNPELSPEDDRLVCLFVDYWNATSTHLPGNINEIVREIIAEYAQGYLPSDVVELIDEVNELQRIPGCPDEDILDGFYTGLSMLPKVSGGEFVDPSKLPPI